jgi:trehalose 6-phosphate phosphatase
MSYLFDHLDIVEDVIGQQPLGLFSDIDGTISEIVPIPGGARVSPICYRALSELSHRLPLVALVSGRSIAQMRRMIELEGVAYVSSHGFELYIGGEVVSKGEDYRALLIQALAELKGLLDIEGVSLENNGLTAAVHYRRCPQPQVTREAILKALANSEAVRSLRVFEGRKLFVLRPPLPVDKGTAVMELVHSYHLKGAIYLGDDATDVDAFTALRRNSEGSSFRGLSVGVIAPEAPPQVAAQADLTLEGVADVERFLVWLLGAVAAAEPQYP